MRADLPKVGDVIAGRYKIERPLAEGGMGAVFVARHATTEALVALKVLTESSAVALAGFRLEAKIAGQTGSPHIVRVEDADFDPERSPHFIAMELLTGRSLEQLVQEQGRCALADVVTYVEQIARGLDAAHKCKPRSIIHRDIKAENLFLAERNGESPIVKILDFGLAKPVSKSAAVSQDARGTPLYMAPEQWRGEELSPETDIWALGLVAFFLLAGSEYWLRKDDRLETLFLEICYGATTPASQRFRELTQEDAPWPAAFDDWFAKAVNHEREHRFQSAGAAATALRRSLLPESAGADGEAVRTAPTRKPVTFSRATTLLQESYPPAVPEQAPQARTTRKTVLLAVLSLLALLAVGLLALRYRDQPPHPTAINDAAQPSRNEEAADVQRTESPKLPEREHTMPAVETVEPRQTPIQAPRAVRTKRSPVRVAAAVPAPITQERAVVDAPADVPLAPAATTPPAPADQAPRGSDDFPTP